MCTANPATLQPIILAWIAVLTAVIPAIGGAALLAKQQMDRVRETTVANAAAITAHSEAITMIKAEQAATAAQSTPFVKGPGQIGGTTS